MRHAGNVEGCQSENVLSVGKWEEEDEEEEDEEEEEEVMEEEEEVEGHVEKVRGINGTSSSNYSNKRATKNCKYNTHSKIATNT